MRISVPPKPLCLLVITSTRTGIAVMQCSGGNTSFDASDGWVSRHGPPKGGGGVLWVAVKDYATNCIRVEGIVSNCSSAEKYGYPINCWDVGRVTNFKSLFSYMTTFNEDISSWNTSEVCRFVKVSLFLPLFVLNCIINCF